MRWPSSPRMADRCFLPCPTMNVLPRWIFTSSWPSIFCEKQLVSAGRAARIAGLPLGEFIDRLAALKIPVVRYSSDDLSREIAEFGLRRGGRKPVDRA